MLIKVILLVLFLAYSGGIFYGGVVWSKRVNGSKSISSLTNPTSPSFASINGSVEGKIVQVVGEKAYVETSKGGKLIFAIPEQVRVNQFKDGRVEELGNSKQSVKLGESSYIRIAGFNNGFAITSITYVSGELNEVGKELLPEQ